MYTQCFVRLTARAGELIGRHTGLPIRREMKETLERRIPPPYFWEISVFSWFLTNSGAQSNVIYDIM